LRQKRKTHEQPYADLYFEYSTISAGISYTLVKLNPLTFHHLYIESGSTVYVERSRSRIFKRLWWTYLLFCFRWH